jgi:hypothetical protein
VSTGDGVSAAVTSAEAGARAWRSAVHDQRAAAPDHGDFYGLAAELVDTLRSLEALTGVLGRQVAGYGQGRVLRDDAGEQPAARLAEAVAHLTRAGQLLAVAERAANAYWSAIGHVAVDGGQP